MGTRALVFSLLLSACTSFTFEVRVALDGDQTTILLDGEQREATHFDGSYHWIVMTEVFAGYQEGKAAPGFHVEILRDGESVYEAQLRPGYCGRNSGETDWTEETVYVNSSPQYLGVGRYDCRAPGRHTTSVF
jgi:hypothetical protein